ncbi:peptidylprolyl isomerase [Alkalilacustris brevis]|uniref:peptidylprolyl isomerase n=1 Tax=Alkalilacustris brevis TaxID=2026338 RepID=UPI001EE3E71D|nr:peptidylprolyl isomerase [Alkalilacustris brevis]
MGTRREALIVGGLFALGFAVLGGFYYAQTRPAPQPPSAGVDTGGPYLVIELGGQVSGEVVIDLRDDVAPLHVERVITLAEAGAYDGVVFHRVIEGFMAQTGDVRFGRVGGDPGMAGRGGSDLPDLPLEPSDLPFDTGAVGMARADAPDSANSQFFIMLDRHPQLDRQYTVLGSVVEGMAHVHAIARGDPRAGGRVEAPDYMARVRLRE